MIHILCFDEPITTISSPTIPAHKDRPYSIMITTTLHHQASGPALRSFPLRHASSSILYTSTSSLSRLTCATSLHSSPARLFSTTPTPQIRDFFPKKETNHIRKTPPVWPHHGHTMEEMLAVEPAHRPPRGFGDWAAWKIVRIARWNMDFFTGMSRKQASDPKKPTTAIAADEPFTESQWVRSLLQGNF